MIAKPGPPYKLLEKRIAKERIQTFRALLIWIVVINLISRSNTNKTKGRK
jgi:hypothetical protein